MMKPKRIYLTAAFLACALTSGAQDLSVEGATLDVGQVVYRRPVTGEFELTNTGKTPLSIRDVRTSCGCTTVDYPRRSIAPGEKFSVKATYDAKQMGHFNKQIGLYPQTGQPVMLTLQGVVVDEIRDFSGEYPFEMGQLGADKNYLEFDDVNRGDRPIQSIHIINRTSEMAQPQVMHLPPYLRAEVSPTRLRPHHAGVVHLMLDSRALQDYGLTQTSVYLGFRPGDKIAAGKAIDVSAVLLPGFDQLSEAQIRQAPHIWLSTETLDLGAFGNKKKLKGEIILQNTGKTTLDIRNLQVFTTGIGVSLPKTKIAPGEKVRMKITAEARQLKAARSQPRVLMITNDPERPKVVIQIKAK